MKRIFYIGIFGMITVVLLSSCSLFSNKREAQPRNGMLLIGDEQPLQEIISQYKSEINSHALYKIKQSKIEGDNTLILKRSTIEELIKQALLQKPDDEKSPNFSDVQAVKTLPITKKDTTLLLSRYDTSVNIKKIKEIKINGIKFKVQHDSPSWFGYGPDSSFEAIIAVVSDEMFDEIPVLETSMVTLNFKESYGSLTDEITPPDISDNDAFKKNTEWLRLAKNIKKRVKYLKSISYLEK
ncbi:lipoprotein BA_5634 family protein [Bacillus cereus]|nr:lipoprotein BA_5634 family protein [Bacillus cereus]